MKTFLKANVASVIATTCDYGLTFLLKEVFNKEKVIFSIWGTVLGGVVNFFICRHWAFKASGGAIHRQGKKYFITWTGNLLLNAGGVFLLHDYAGFDLMPAKLITSLTVALAYNYPLQKKYVFKNI